MVPRPTRRQYLGGLSLAAVATLAGCTESLSESPDTSTTESTTQTTESTTRTTTESESGPSTAESPGDAFRKFVETAAEEPAAARQYFHPIHPFGPEKLSADDAEELFGGSSEPEDVSLETDERELSGEAVLQQSFLRNTDLETSDVAAAIEGEQTAVVEADVAQAGGETEDNSLVTVTHDGGWVILAQAFQPGGDEADPGPFDTRVVDGVTFDTEEDTARVSFVDGPVADEVTVKAEEAFSERSTTTPDPIDYFDLQVDPDGDTLVVTATIDDETHEIHREQYPPSESVVAAVMYDDDPDDDARDAAARVTVADDWESDTLTVAATISGDEATLEPDSGTDHAVVGIDPDADEVVVSRTADGESTVVHRERHHF